MRQNSRLAWSERFTHKSGGWRRGRVSEQSTETLHSYPLHFEDGREDASDLVFHTIHLTSNNTQLIDVGTDCYTSTRNTPLEAQYPYDERLLTKSEKAPLLSLQSTKALSPTAADVEQASDSYGVVVHSCVRNVDETRTNVRRGQHGEILPKLQLTLEFPSSQNDSATGVNLTREAEGIEKCPSFLFSSPSEGDDVLRSFKTSTACVEPSSYVRQEENPKKVDLHIGSSERYGSIVEGKISKLNSTPSQRETKSSEFDASVFDRNSGEVIIATRGNVPVPGRCKACKWCDDICNSPLSCGSCYAKLPRLVRLGKVFVSPECEIPCEDKKHASSTKAQNIVRKLARVLTTFTLSSRTPSPFPSNCPSISSGGDWNERDLLNEVDKSDTDKSRNLLKRSTRERGPRNAERNEESDTESKNEPLSRNGKTFVGDLNEEGHDTNNLTDLLQHERFVGKFPRARRRKFHRYLAKTLHNGQLSSRGGAESDPGEADNGINPLSEYTIDQVSRNWEFQRLEIVRSKSSEPIASHTGRTTRRKTIPEVKTREKDFVESPGSYIVENRRELSEKTDVSDEKSFLSMQPGLTRKVCRTKKSYKIYYSCCEISHHDKEDDAWIVAHGIIYNVTHIMHQHPGGTKTFQRFLGGKLDCGRDFDFHSSQSRKKYWDPLTVGRAIKCRRPNTF